MRLVDAATMQQVDAAFTAELGATELMQRAGRAIAAFVRRVAHTGHIVAFAGPGNNGGDAFAACAELAPTVHCTIYGAPSKPEQTVRLWAEERARAAGVTIMPLPQNDHDAAAALETATCVLDGILGVGARNATEAFAAILTAVDTSGVPVLALDLPTGIDSTNGAVAEPVAVHAQWTLMLGLPKIGAFFPTARAYCGELWYHDIGTADAPTSRTIGTGAQLTTAADAASLLPHRPWESDKRISGAPLIFAGSHNYPGAAILSAGGAARMGAGYVTVATPEAAASTLRAHLVEQVVVSLDTGDLNAALDALQTAAKRVTAIAIGPGLGNTPEIGHLVRELIRTTSLPLVIDAGGLVHIKSHLELLRNRACVITPHAGEFAQLTDSTPLEMNARIPGLRKFVDATGITTLLKGNSTIIADTRQTYLNPTGTNALATAGTGDILTGMIATLLSQGLPPIDAARLGAYLHGLAGQDAAKERVRGVMAGDLPNVFPRVWKSLDAYAGKLRRNADDAVRLDSIPFVAA